MPWIKNKDNGAVDQIVRNNSAAANIVTVFVGVWLDMVQYIEEN